MIPSWGNGNLVCFATMFFALLLGVTANAAQTYTLADGNSSASFDPTSQSGINNWTVEGQNQLATASFWYRLGSSGTAAAIGTLGPATVLQSAPGMLSVTYQNNQFSMQVVYSLIGGAAGSGTSDLSEQVRIQNLTGAALAFNFFQYSDFSLAGTNNQSVQLGKNRQGTFNEALLSSGNTSITENIDSAISPGATRGEAAMFGATLNNLQNSSGYNLNNNMDAGPGNATWALQWNNGIAANGTLTISEDLSIAGVPITVVPEPEAWSVLSFGLLMFVAIKWFSGRRSDTY